MNEIRRFKKLQFEPQAWIDSIEEGNVVRVLTGLPKGTVYVSSYFDFTGRLNIVLWNEAWPELKAGEKIPDIEQPVFEKANAPD